MRGTRCAAQLKAIGGASEERLPDAIQLEARTNTCTQPSGAQIGLNTDRSAGVRRPANNPRWSSGQDKVADAAPARGHGCCSWHRFFGYLSPARAHVDEAFDVSKQSEPLPDVHVLPTPPKTQSPELATQRTKCIANVRGTDSRLLLVAGSAGCAPLRNNGGLTENRLLYLSPL